MTLNRDLKCFIQPLTYFYLSKQYRPQSDAALCGVWSGYKLFASVPAHEHSSCFRDNPQSTALWRHSSAAMNSRYLDFQQMLFHGQVDNSNLTQIRNWQKITPKISRLPKVMLRIMLFNYTYYPIAQRSTQRRGEGYIGFVPYVSTHITEVHLLSSL